MKISLVGSYNLADGYLGAANALKRKGVEVDFIPAHKYFSEFPKDHVSKIIEDLKSQDPDVVLWWRAETLEENELFRIKSQIEKPFAMYSWDDPNQFEARIRNVREKIKHFDYCFTCCEGSVFEYQNYGCKNSFYCLPGFDPEVHYPEEDEKYKCDISLVCTNLYHGNQITGYPHISRKMLMQSIVSNFPDLDVRIYGFEGLKEHFPEHYKGWIPFNDSRKVFHNSKINISTHIRPDGYKYLNERVMQILGSKGLLVVDMVNGIDQIIRNENECVILDKISPNEIKNKIIDILENEEKYNKIRENGYNYAKKNLTWDNWAENILRYLK